MAVNFGDFGRIYINISEDYDFPRKPNMMDLVREVAKANPQGDIEPLYDPQSGKIYEGRTKAFIVRETRKYVKDMHEVACNDENMSRLISKRQLNKLLRAFIGGKKRISAYGLIYIYVIFTLLSGKYTCAGTCTNYLKLFNSLVYAFYRDNPNDQLASFFNKCFKPLDTAIRTQNTKLDNSLLPAIPRFHVRDDE